jgi:hypothetical protein
MNSRLSNISNHLYSFRKPLDQKMAEASTSVPSTTPYRQIRALYDSNTITVYQAYSETIAEAAVAAQKLSASPHFELGTRMTWIKPSWCWVNYRAGYSYKDDRQARILALKMKHSDFLKLLNRAQLSHVNGDTKDSKAVRVQWDPERTPRLEKLPYRSIQIGISRELTKIWVEEWIVSIEDVTETARALKAFLDEHKDADVKDLVEAGLMPVECVFDVPDRTQKILGMGET